MNTNKTTNVRTEKKTKVPINVLRKGVLTAMLGVSLLGGAVILSGCGKQGPQGQAGSTWYSGTEYSASQGIVGDFFYDTDDHDIYRKTADGWTWISNIKGDQGPQGTAGTAPVITINEEGYWVINGIPTTTKAKGEDGTNGTTPTITINDDGYWVINGTPTDVKAEAIDGTNGKDGATWLSGMSTPTADIGNNGDFYLDKTTFSIYEKVSGAWEYLTTLATTDSIVPKQGWDEDGKLKILSIGNSFSDDSLEHAYEIAQDLGVENVEIGKLYIASCSLETHLSNAQNNTAAYTYYFNDSGEWDSSSNYAIETAVKSTNWDYITFQQNSNNSGLADTYDDLQPLIEIVAPMAPRAKLVWNMTWAYPEGSTHAGFANYSSDQITMYNAIVDAVETKILTNDNIDLVMPVGTAIQNARSSYLDDTIISRDYCHLSHDFGTYTASLAVVQALTGLSIENVSYAPSGVFDIEKGIAIESVCNALSTPYAVTQSTYDDRSDYYDQIDIGVLGLGYYNSTDVPNADGVLVHYVGSTPETSTGAWVDNYLLTKKFSREDLPVGTIIELESGYAYRPEGWIDAARNTTRPAEVTASRVVVDEEWWGDYTERAFNINANGKPAITDANYDLIASALKIYVPKTIQE